VKKLMGLKWIECRAVVTVKTHIFWRTE